ncbi:MAG TPA: phosphatidylserine decarboxylase, partial [Hanamia sp.]|nr:phosphatidylserine decarboxylase [Hanamia sp.]
SDKAEILVKQIAGALAKRIVNYLHVGQKVQQADEMGFIKFGSRVDVLLPVGTELNVSLNQVVKGGVTVLATIDTIVPADEVEETG